jgi:RNA polymerase subunit RPABC4/transcription elongation factor Spt4
MAGAPGQPAPPVPPTPGFAGGGAGFVGQGGTAVGTCTAGCGAAVPSGAKFCPGCGAAQTATQFCIACGVEMPSGAKFCPSCGESQTPTAQDPTPPSSPEEPNAGS